MSLVCFIANTPADADDDLYVLVPDFDGGAHRHGPVHWQPHPDDTLPSDGDRGVLLEDDDGDEWLLAWASST